MFRFQPTVESLDIRTLPSAVLARPEQPTGDHTPATIRIDSPIQDVAKVKLTDFHFTAKVTKSSPG